MTKTIVNTINEINAMGAVCTLSEKNYHYGVGALVNSLYAGGFRGKFICGHRGELPSWAKNVRSMGTRGDSRVDVFSPAKDLEVYFVCLSTPMHFSNYKPTFMLELLKEGGLAQEAERLYYFDPDIVAKCSWRTLELWAKGGVALCEDGFAGYSGYFPERHPTRIAWLEWMKEHGFSLVAPRDRYYNAGFVGVPRNQKEFLEVWRQINAKVCETIGTDKKINFASREHPFYIPDQNAMNIALMCMEVVVNASGLEGMDFAPNGSLLSHAVRNPKPWEGGYLKRAIFGKAPSAAARNFVKNIDGVIRVFPPLRAWWLKTSLRLAKEIARR